MDLVADRKIGMKHQLYVTGVTSVEYWIAEVLTYIPIFSLLTLVATGLIFGSGIESLTGNGGYNLYTHLLKVCMELAS